MTRDTGVGGSLPGLERGAAPTARTPQAAHTPLLVSLLPRVTDGDSAAPRAGQASRGLRLHRPRRPTRPGLSGRGVSPWPVGSHGGNSSPTPGWLQADPEPAVGPGKSSRLWARVPAASGDVLTQELRGPCSGPCWVAVLCERKGRVLRPHQGGPAGGRVGAVGPEWPEGPACPRRPRGRSRHRQDRTWEGRRPGVPAATRDSF